MSKEQRMDPEKRTLENYKIHHDYTKHTYNCNEELVMRHRRLEAFREYNQCRANEAISRGETPRPPSPDSSGYDSDEWDALDEKIKNLPDEGIHRLDVGFQHPFNLEISRERLNIEEEFKNNKRSDHNTQNGSQSVENNPNTNESSSENIDDSLFPNLGPLIPISVIIYQSLFNEKSVYFMCRVNMLQEFYLLEAKISLWLER